jgi:ABC-2 type transport system permease protein
MTAVFRYEFAMQVRRPSLWIVYGLVFVVIVATLPYWSLDLGMFRASVPREAMGVAAQIVVTLLPVVYGCLLADRPARDRVLRVDGVLDATPSSRTARLIGKYAGVCAATAVPFAVVYFGRAVAYAVVEGAPSALGWAAVTFAASILPGLVFVGALAFAGALLVPPMIFRVLFVAYWFWGNVIPARLMPTLSGTVFSATGEYARYGLLTPIPQEYGRGPEAVLDFLRPAYTPASAWLWIGVMIALAAAVLTLVRLHASGSAS